ncbi:MAG: AAA family ATPase [Proteobacteria bacterium]|nr:AAA family ATPase [Pseudomonadota bacterium]
MEWSRSQQAVLKHHESALVVGPPGSGKTLLLLEKAHRLITSGQKAALCTFAFRSLEYIKSYAHGHYPQFNAHIATGGLRAGTLRDLAAAQLQAAGEPFSFVSNNQVREILRTLVAQQAFPGTLSEAEHIIRAAKSHAKKLPETDRHYAFVSAYQHKLEELGLLDRHDIIRRHVLGMREGKVPPLPVSHILLDNLQDATELQLIWLQMHMGSGVALTMAADDDITAFVQDGAMGLQAIEAVEAWPDITRFNLEVSFRLPKTLAPAINKIARQLKHRATKGDGTANPNPGDLRAEAFPSAVAEHAFLASTCSQLLAQAKGSRLAIGILTRDDFTASLITQVLRKAGMNPASYARLIWENPTAQLVLAMLYVMLGQATPAHLQLVLIGFGLPAGVVTGLFSQGLRAEGWLAAGCPLPPLEGLTPPLQTAVQRVRRAFAGAGQLLQAKAMPPRDVFKSLVAELLTTLPAAEHPEALLATDTLLSLSGKLTEVLPRVMQETLPNMESPITVAPVREVRNMEFTTVILPHAGAASWPWPPQTLLGPNPDHERRMFYLAISRTRANLLLTWHTPQPSPFLGELQQTLKNQAKKGAA